MPESAKNKSYRGKWLCGKWLCGKWLCGKWLCGEEPYRKEQCYKIQGIKTQHNKRLQNSMHRIFSIIIIIALLGILPNTARSATTKIPQSDFPKKANYFLSWSMTDAQARELAKWDMIILDMEIQERQPDMIRKIRKLNSDIIILVYITPQEIRQDAPVSYSRMRARLFAGIQDDWFLKDTSGRRLSWWPETYLLNITQSAPLKNSKRFNDYIADFVVDQLLSGGLWDGVFYDNAWDNITYFAGTTNIDLNGDHRADSDANSAWQTGMKRIYTRTRERGGNNIIILGNGNTTVYSKELDGQMFENFQNLEWSQTMNRYKTAVQDDGEFSIINANTANTGDNSDYRRMRFGLTSALLEDGYYAFDFGDKSHGQVWWYDEYNVDLGRPNGSALSNTSAKTYTPDIWRRDFANGAVLVNSTNQTKQVVLGGDFEKIHGTQDTDINDGAIVSETTLAPNDGIVLLKTFEKLNNVAFTNGDFVRFMRADGSRVRNGFFVSESEYVGGDTIIRTDMNNDGKQDLAIVHGTKLSVWRDDGQLYAQIYPYTANYRGEINISVGDLENDGKKEIIVAPSAGFGLPVKIYSYDGVLKKTPWYPLGTNYTGGFSTAITHSDKPQIIIGSGKGVRPEVFVFNTDLQYVSSWYAYETGFRGGISVAAGDVNGDNVDEIITGPGPGKAPAIKVFDPFGALFYKEFIAFTSFVNLGVKLQVTDVDFDGIGDILVFSSGL